MKNQIKRCYRTPLLLLLWISTTIPLLATNIALIVAVGHYPESSGWPKISATNDIALIRSALLSQRFSEKNIFELRDSTATKAGIISAIKDHLLKRAKPGDIVLFHFSGHGQQMQDYNGDELDGYDEAIVPFDSPIKFSPGVYEGQNLIRDDELGALFKKIRQKIGKTGQLIVVLDSCHSGTGTRGFAMARGTQQKMADSTWIVGQLATTTKLAEKQFDYDDTKLAPMVAFFGSSQDQLNYETTDQQGRSVGSLSYAFSKSFSKMGPNTSYRGLFENIRLEMAIVAPRQTPQVEGALDREVLDGNIVAQQSFFRVKYTTAAGKVQVAGGWLQGLTEGSVVGFYPPQTTDIQNAKLLAEGTVISSKPLLCTIQTDSILGEITDLPSAWVFLLEQNPGNLNVNLRLVMPDGPVKAALLHQFEKLALIKITEPADLILIESADSLAVISADEQNLGQFSIAKTSEAVLKRKILQVIKNTGQIKFLRSLSATSAHYNLSAEIIPVAVDQLTKEVHQLPVSDFTGPNGLLRLPIGAYFKIMIHNAGSKMAYFNLIDIQPNNEFKIIIPSQWNPNETAEEFSIQPGQSILLNKPWEVGEPYGQEIFKLIATDAPVDLRSIQSSGGAMKRGINKLTPLEQLFSDSYYTDDINTRGGEVKRVKAGSLGVSTLNFEITPVGN